MEFFADTGARLSAEQIQRRIRIDNLPTWCASIEKVLSHTGEKGEIFCLWGTFWVHREVVRDGVRFTLPGCPNALQWTVTSLGGSASVHCTIARREHDPDFIESIEQFVQDWKSGLDAPPAMSAASVGTGACLPCYG